MGENSEPSGRRVVFVGKRRGALAAARRLGLEVLLVSERPPRAGDRPPVVAHHPWREGEPESVVAAAESFATHLPAAAVLALTEGSVAPAAALRARLGVEGLGLEVAARCTDKQKMKSAIAAAGLPCARWLGAEEGLDGPGLAERLGLPLFLKPRAGSGSRDTRRVATAEELPAALLAGQMAESEVRGEEMSVEALLDVGRVLFSNPTEYLIPGRANIVPRPTDRETREEIESLLARALPALGVERGLVHMELFLTPAGPVFGELAARAPGGYLLRLVELAYGFDLWEAWLRTELGDPPACLPRRATRFAGARLFHPGGGTLRAIAGVDETAALPGVLELEVRRKPGDEIPPRLGVSQEVAHLIVTGGDRDAVARTLLEAGELLRFELEPGAS